MAKLYYVSSEGAGILNPGERGFRKLEKAEALAAEEAEKCSWECLTPPVQDNDQGNGRFLCGVMSAHGIHIRAEEDNNRWVEEYSVPETEEFRKTRVGKHVDWTLSVIIDRGTDALADGADTLYFTGPERTDIEWDQILEDYAGSDTIVEATVRPTPSGRYHHLDGGDSDYPMEWEKGYGF